MRAQSYHIWETVCRDNPKSAYVIIFFLPNGYQPAMMIIRRYAFWTDRGYHASQEREVIMPAKRRWSLDDVRCTQVAWSNASLHQFYVLLTVLYYISESICVKQIILQGIGYRPQYQPSPFISRALRFDNGVSSWYFMRCEIISKYIMFSDHNFSLFLSFQLDKHLELIQFNYGREGWKQSRNRFW